MEQNEDELMKKANEFLANIQKNRSDQERAEHDAYWEKQKKEIERNVKWRIGMDVELFKRSQEVRQIFPNSKAKPQKDEDKKATDWGGYLLMGFLGVIALFLIAYGLILAFVILLLLTIQHFVGSKRW